MCQSAKDNLHEADTKLENDCELELHELAPQRRLISLIATISKASRNLDTIRDMILTGVNIIRLNFSHESHESHAHTIALVKEALEHVQKTKGYSPTVAFALDTRGPQIRTGLIEGGGDLIVRKGDLLRLSINRDLYDKGNKETIYVDYPNIINLTKQGDRMFIDDGKLYFIIQEVGVDGIVGECVLGGSLGSNRNVILPEVEIDLPAVSEKDLFDLQFGLTANVDYVFASAVRSAKSIKELRSVLGEKGKNIKIVAKIDSKISLSRVSEIMKEADGLLLARADLGTQIPAQKLFITQKAVLAQCNRMGKPVIVASHILESMRFTPYPTRAEVFDLSNVVLDGADCVMLSSEVAIGPYPMETVMACNMICSEAEKVIWHRDLFAELVSSNRSELDAAHALAISAVESARRAHATLIIVLTGSGNSAALISRYRPRCPIMAVTRCLRASRWVQLHRGIIPLLYTEDVYDDWITESDARVKFGLTNAKKMELIENGDPIVIVSAWRGGGGFTNNLRIVYAFFEADRVDCLFKVDRRASKRMQKVLPVAAKTEDIEQKKSLERATEEVSEAADDDIEDK